MYPIHVEKSPEGFVIFAEGRNATFSEDEAVALVKQVELDIQENNDWAHDYTNAWNVRKDAGFSREALDAFTIGYGAGPKAKIRAIPGVFFSWNDMDMILAILQEKVLGTPSAVMNFMVERGKRNAIINKIWREVISENN